jgi:large subunit ribosomal protein L34
MLLGKSDRKVLDILAYTHTAVCRARHAVPTLHTAYCPSPAVAQSGLDQVAAPVDSSPSGCIATRTIACLPTDTCSTHSLTIYYSRTFSLLSSRRPTLPTTPTSTLSLNTTLELPTLPAASTTLTLLQARGPKRDTFDPSHRVRKRRSGFLARIRSRNGRNLIKRRLLKKRSTLSH